MPPQNNNTYFHEEANLFHPPDKISGALIHRDPIFNETYEGGGISYPLRHITAQKAFGDIFSDMSIRYAFRVL